MKKVILISALALFIGLMGGSINAEAIPIWNGITHFAQTWTSPPETTSGQYDVDVYWTVYAPNDTVQGSGHLPNAAGNVADFAYVFRVDNYASSTVGVVMFTAANPFALPITNAGYVDGAGANPSNVAFGVGGTFFSFAAAPMGGTGSYVQSDVLWYTTPYSPVNVLGGIQSQGGPNDYHDIPGPIVPEPASMALFGMGLFGFVGGVIRKRFKA